MLKKQRIGELFCGPGGLGYAAIKNERPLCLFLLIRKVNK